MLALIQMKTLCFLHTKIDTKSDIKTREIKNNQTKLHLIQGEITQLIMLNNGDTMAIEYNT